MPRKWGFYLTLPESKATRLTCWPSRQEICEKLTWLPLAPVLVIRAMQFRRNGFFSPPGKHACTAQQPVHSCNHSTADTTLLRISDEQGCRRSFDVHNAGHAICQMHTPAKADSMQPLTHPDNGGGEGVDGGHGAGVVHSAPLAAARILLGKRRLDDRRRMLLCDALAPLECQSSWPSACGSHSAMVPMFSAPLTDMRLGTRYFPCPGYSALATSDRLPAIGTAGD